MNTNPKIKSCSMYISSPTGEIGSPSNVTNGVFTQTQLTQIRNARVGSILSLEGYTIGEDQITYPFSFSIVLR